MSDKADSKGGLATFLTRFTAPIVGIISLITTLHNFTKLFADKDTELLTLISLIIAILLLIGVCLYYARFWKPELSDKNSSAFAPAPTDEQVKRQQQKEQQRKLVRRSAIAGLILIPILSIAGFAGWQHWQNQPIKGVLILVADFEGPDAQNYFVTKTIVENLESATEPYADVTVKRLNQILHQRQEARKIGEQRKASIVIWGSYGKTKDMVPISANFELLNPPEYLPELGAEAKGKVRTAAAAELENFTLQTRLSQEMTYLTLVTLGMSRYAVKDWDGAVSLFSAALEQTKEPVKLLDQSEIYFARAYSHQQKRDHKQAITDYSQTIKLKPNYALAYNNRGNAYSDLEQFNQAIKDYTQAIQINQNWGDFNPSYFGLPTAYSNRGITYSDLKQFDKAIEDLNQAIKLKPDYSNAYYNRGSVYINLQQFDQAIKDFNQAIKLKPTDSDAYIYRGVAYRNSKQFDRAITDYTQALKLSSDYALAYNNRGNVYSDLRQFDQAIIDYTQAIQLKPDYALAYNNRGDAYSYLKQFDRAIADFNQAIKLQPDDADAYNYRGAAYGEMKEYTKALADLNQALKLEPDTGDIYDTRGTVYRYMRKYDLALKDYTQAIKLDPTLDESYLWRGVIYLERAERQKAIQDFKQVLKLTKNPEFKQRAQQELEKMGNRG